MFTLTAVVAANVAATRRARLLTLELRDRAFDFAAGQAVDVRVPGAPMRWSYSVACSPEWTRETGCVEILARVPTWMAGRGELLAEQDTGRAIEITGPIGTLVLPTLREDGHVLFVAGGTGIAPIRAMIDHLVRRPAAPAMTLLYSARDAHEFAFLDELTRHARDGRLALRRTVTRFDGARDGCQQGRIDAALMLDVLPRPDRTVCVLCGPPALVSASASWLHALGVPSGQIRTEQPTLPAFINPLAV